MRLSSVLCGKTHRETPYDRRDWPGGFAAPGRQENDVGQASDGLKSSSPDDGGLNLAVDVFCGGIAGIKPVGGKNAGQMGLQDFAQAFVRVPADCVGPRISRDQTRARDLPRPFSADESPCGILSCARRGRS
jgi:hypothetical protein